ncbi:MAG: MG2 domain-containing protein [Bacteroidota bacterium]
MQQNILPLSLFLLISWTGLAQVSLEESMNQYYHNFLPEKIYVHTDKNIYAAGEQVWLSVYLMDGISHRPGTLSNLVRIELQDAQNKVMAEQKLFSEEGYMAGDFFIPATVLPGTYQLLAFTNYQRNGGDEILFRKPIRILPGLKDIRELVKEGNFVARRKEVYKKPVNLRFFPEGGDCLNGIPCRVAFVCENDDGQPVRTQAILKTKSGEEVLQMDTDEYGMGSFYYKPLPGEKYQAIEKSGFTFSLPAALDQGYHLSVQKRKTAVRIIMETNIPSGLVGARLGIHLRGFILLDQQLSNEKGKAILDLPLTDFDPGVHVVTLFDQQELPVAERLFFIPLPQGENEIGLTLNKTVYKTRELAELALDMSAEKVEEDSLAMGNISMSVLPATFSNKFESDDIRTWMMLNSDLDRPVPYTPEMVFADDTKVQDRRIDEFLLTRGWRRFKWEQAFKSEVFLPNYYLEKGIYVMGKMGKYDYPHRPVPGMVFLTQPENMHFEESAVDEEGVFYFGPYVLFDTVDIMLQGRSTKPKHLADEEKKYQKSSRFTHMEILEYTSPNLPPIDVTLPDENTGRLIDEYQDLSQKTLTIARSYDSLSITLDAVDVIAKRMLSAEQKRKERVTLYQEPDRRVEVDSIPGGTSYTFFDLIRNEPGVIISGGLGKETIQMRGQTSIKGSSVPSFFIDGYQVDLEFLRFMRGSEIEFIDIIRGLRAAHLGAGGTNGAILVYTREGGVASTLTPGLIKTKIYGFHKARQFAVFDPTAPGNQNRPDLRTTLHWNGLIKTNLRGEATEFFSTSDQKGTYVIIAQGLRKDGQPFYGTSRFEVK